MHLTFGHKVKYQDITVISVSLGGKKGIWYAQEFYEVIVNTSDFAESGKKLLEWERVYNTILSHQALGYLIPPKHLEEKRGGQVSLII